MSFAEGSPSSLRVLSTGELCPTVNRVLRPWGSESLCAHHYVYPATAQRYLDLAARSKCVARPPAKIARVAAHAVLAGEVAYVFWGRAARAYGGPMTTDDGKTPQQRLEENPELMEQITASMARGREGTVPRTPREDRHTEDVIPPELRPHRW